MNLLVPRPARVAALGLAFTLFATGLACRPENDVEPGPPVIKKLIIAQMTPFGPMGTSILPTTGDCAPSAADGMACQPPTEDMPVGDVFCRQVSASNWCDCIATDASDPTLGGTWACPTFANVASVIAVFDRVIDTTPFTDPEGEPMAIEDAATATAMGIGDVAVLSDYASNGNEPGLIFPIYGPFFGNLRQEGPTVGVSPAGAFPSGTAVTVTLKRDVLQAKDRQNGFTGEGLLQDGVITFTTAPFAGELAGPDPMGDPTVVTASFTNFIDPVAVGALTTVTVNGSPAEVTFDTSTGSDLVITTETPWPSGATVVVTIDAAATNLAGQMLGAPVTVTFMAP